MIIYNLCSFLRESAQGEPCVLTRLTNRVSFVEELGRKALQREERRVEEAILGKLQKIGQKTMRNFSPFHLLRGRYFGTIFFDDSNSLFEDPTD